MNYLAIVEDTKKQKMEQRQMLESLEFAEEDLETELRGLFRLTLKLESELEFATLKEN